MPQVRCGLSRTAFSVRFLSNASNLASKGGRRIDQGNGLAATREVITFIKDERKFRATQDQAVAVIGLDEVFSSAHEIIAALARGVKS